MTLEEALNRIKELEKENQDLKTALDMACDLYRKSSKRHLEYALSHFK